MKRKEIGINKVYDARALRVIVGDKNGALHGQAVQCCYNLLNIVHRCINRYFLFCLISTFIHIIGLDMRAAMAQKVRKWFVPFEESAHLLRTY